MLNLSTCRDPDLAAMADRAVKAGVFPHDEEENHRMATHVLHDKVKYRWCEMKTQADSNPFKPMWRCRVSLSRKHVILYRGSLYQCALASDCIRMALKIKGSYNLDATIARHMLRTNQAIRDYALAVLGHFKMKGYLAPVKRKKRPLAFAEKIVRRLMALESKMDRVLELLTPKNTKEPPRSGLDIFRPKQQPT